MILVVSDVFDAHADLVCSQLNKAFFRLNLDIASLQNTSLSFDGEKWEIIFQDSKIKSTEISCIWFRRAFVELNSQEYELQNDIHFRLFKNEWNAILNGLWAYLKKIPALNPLKEAYAGENKFYQIMVAKEVGFQLPKMLVSNKKQQCINFLKQQKSIFKVFNQDFYLKNEKLKGIYTNIISQSDFDDFDARQNPILLQEYVSKSYEVRYTFVENKHFVCKIDSQQSKIANIDWRKYDLAHTPHEAIKPPEEIAMKVNLFSQQMGLKYGAIDFIVMPNNTWIFLEINCFGQWMWIETLSGLNISHAIASWLDSYN
ncbi:hypothetical protein CQA53_00110 [Helicobacter didelphidarum]|uniref:ATP-grasp fold RimK-type domain-containing protein n=1 Tax=Helicobacter didelphidarum TaxID=2040648 RepID=A0A3D8IQK4_9HELI|nr:hypothetical protein [Helicobacter didelphidarum]RDU67472.1 hypothetical protein CQA53_00110 [Helicobacter didelphidarum]